MKNRIYFNRLMKIAVPIMLGSVISQLQMIIDKIFLGQANTLYMSALGNVMSPMWTTMSFCFAITAGASILVSQNVGAGDQDTVKKYTASLLKWNNLPSVILLFFWLFCSKPVFDLMGVPDSVMPYCMSYVRYFLPVFLLIGIEGSFSVLFQTSNYTKPLVYYGVIRSVTNIVLDYALIFGHFGLPALGIEGAAIATTIAEYAGSVFCLGFLWSDKLTTRPTLSQIWSAKIGPYLKSLRLGVNCALEDMAWNVGNLMIIRILNSISDMAAGIYSLVFSIEVLAVVIINSVGNATMTLTSEAKGKGDATQYKTVVRIAYLISMVVNVIMIIVCALFPEQILRLFSSDRAIYETCGIYLLMVCINLVGKSGNIIVGSGIKGSGNTRWMLGTQVFGTILVVSCASLFVFGFHLQMMGVYIALIVDEGLRALVNLSKFKKITRRWEYDIVH